MANILYPVFALVLLTFLMAFWMARERFASVRRGEIKFEPGVRPVFRDRAGQVSNAYHNLLELPLLFYAVVAFAMLTKGDDGLMIILAWITLHSDMCRPSCMRRTTNSSIASAHSSSALSCSRSCGCICSCTSRAPRFSR